MDACEARTEYQNGRLSVDQLLDLVDRQERMIRRLLDEVQRLRERLTQYEPEAAREVAGGQSVAGNDSPGHFGLEAEERRRRGRKKRKKSPGRRPTQLKFAEAQRREEIYPVGVPKNACQVVRERAVWRLEKGKGILVGYRVYAGPDGREPRIPGVTPHCEYGLEILVVLAFLVYVIGISLDKACAVMGFFCQLPIAKSQADALLRQLARHWEQEYEMLCDLLVEAAVVYLDETGWKVGRESCSLWILASQLHRVFVFGCHKDDATLDQILPPSLFHGIGVSDDAGVYRRRFKQGQKCWAHLLRKIIKLAPLYPRKKSYQRFLDQLLQLYYDAKRAAADQRLGPEGRLRRVNEFEDRLCKLCLIHCRQTSGMKPHERDFANLARELLERMVDQELFTFVLHPEVESTNNLSERLLRSPAQDRHAGRTNRNGNGARRRSIILSVLESLRANLPQFTLPSVLAEVTRWMNDGVSLFRRQFDEAHSSVPAIDTS